MAFNDLPLALQTVIQQGYLERRFNQALKAKLGFRAIADREAFMGGIGETITKTRVGLLAPVTTPMAPAQVTDITSGLNPASYSVEQYVLGIAQYANPMYLNVATSQVAIDSVFLQNAYALGENAMRSVDTLARNALFDRYMGGNTRVTTTLGSGGTAVKVDDVRGFFQTISSVGTVVPVSASNPLTVAFYNSSQAITNTYSLVGVVADGVAPALNPWNNGLTFSGAGTNSSTAPGGFSGTLTFSTNVTVADGTLANSVVSGVAPLILRPSTAAGLMASNTAAISASTDVNSGQLTMQMVLLAKATMAANAVPPVGATGNYVLFHDPIHATGLYNDPEFQSFFRGQQQTAEYRQGVIATQLGVTFVETNQSFIQQLAGVGGSGNIRRAVLCGQGALVEGVFTQTAAAAQASVDDGSGMITVVDDIAHITREPIDAVKQIVTQSWLYDGGFCAPTDTTCSPTTVATASNSALKRAIILESL
jgi:hypothetical protein